MQIHWQWDSYRKILWFATYGAIGCVLAAMAGEAWLALTRSAPPVSSVSICLVLDCSGSMSGAKLDEMKRAAGEFVQRQDLAKTHLAVVGFDTSARVACPVSQDPQALIAAVSRLEEGGSTNMSDGLQTAMTTLAGAPGDRYVLLFTDGAPDVPADTLRLASVSLSQGARIVAVATGDADTAYLSQVTANPALVFPANVGQFEQAFQSAEQAIFGRQLVETDATAAGTAFGVVRIGVWTLLLAVGIGLALIAAQNLYLHRAALRKAEAVRGGLGSALAGFVAGGIGQLLFSGTANAHIVVVELGRIVGWALVGLLLGWGLARFVPNLKPLRGLLGGMAGGVIGALAFLLIGLMLGDAMGRLTGAAALGFCIGAMIALMDVAFREAWLEVHYGPQEMRTVSLGRQPVTIGGDASQATVYISGVSPVALRYILEGGKVYCEDVPSSQRQVIHPGDTRTVGKATVRLQAASAFEANSGTSTGTPARQKAESAISAASTQRSTTNATAVNPNALYLQIRATRIELNLGAKVKAVEIPGLETHSPDQAVAEVVANPQAPTILGLKNLSNRAWEATTADGNSNRIEPGRSVRLADGTKLRFGLTEAKITQ